MTDLDLDAIRERWTTYAHILGCPGDYRESGCACKPRISDPDIAALLAEVERLRAAAPKKAPWVTPDGCDHDGAPEVAPLDDCVRCGGAGLLAPEVVCCCACSECRAEYDNA